MVTVLQSTHHKTNYYYYYYFNHKLTSMTLNYPNLRNLHHCSFFPPRFVVVVVVLVVLLMVPVSYHSSDCIHEETLQG